MSTNNTPTIKFDETYLPVTIDYGMDTGAGFENADADSFAIPFIRILQAMSPQVKKSDAAYIKGAEEGDLFNTVTGKVTKGEEGLLVIPCAYEHNYLLWAPGRKGLRGRMTPQEYMTCRKLKLQNDKGQVQETDEEGNIISDTRNHYVLVVDPVSGSCEPAIISMASSQIKKSKLWMALMQAQRINGQLAPMFANIYKVQTVTDPGNDLGTWMGFKISYYDRVTSVDLYRTAKELNGMFRAGKTKVHEEEDTTAPF